MKKAFTLVEILACLIIISVIAIAMIHALNISDDDAYENLAKVKASKAIALVDEASQKIREMELTKCPMKVFMMETTTGNWEYTLVNASNEAASTSDVYSLYADYIKFIEGNLNFCDYTSKCNDSNIKGGKITGNVYIGFEVLSSISNCPNYYRPDSEGAITGKGKCWGKVYIKVYDNSRYSDELGKDVFIIGLNANGVAY